MTAIPHPLAQTLPNRVFAKPCRFIASADSLAQLPSQSYPEIAVTGRSNVGKSSLLNALAGQTKLAYVSQTPGRTRRINIFDCGNLRLVDLPGYGYARASKRDIHAWQATSMDFLHQRQQLARVLLLIDARRGVASQDQAMMGMLDRAGVGWSLVVTKCDKLTQQAVHALAAEVGQTLAMHPAAWPTGFMTSAAPGKKRMGIDALRQHIAEAAGDGA